MVNNAEHSDNQSAQTVEQLASVRDPAVNTTTNKTAVITGANAGIGYQTALALARAGISVILACRDRSRGEEAVKRIKSESPDARVELSILNLADLASVQEFAEKLSSRIESLDILVNNAAIMAVPQRMVSADGYELQLATNHLGHFALTARLFPLLLNSSAARIVTVSSIAHRYGALNFEDLQAEHHYEGWAVYGMTKLANLMFGFELARRLRARSIPALSLVCHPGVSKTNILSSGPRMGKKVLRTMVSEIFAQHFAQTDAEGSQPAIHA